MIHPNKVPTRTHQLLYIYGVRRTTNRRKTPLQIADSELVGYLGTNGPGLGKEQELRQQRWQLDTYHIFREAVQHCTSSKIKQQHATRTFETVT
jgi:hypothetical protein